MPREFDTIDLINELRYSDAGDYTPEERAAFSKRIAIKKAARAAKAAKAAAADQEPMVDSLEHQASKT